MTNSISVEGTAPVSAVVAAVQECVRLVDEEFSLALGIPRAQVGSYIQERL